MKSAFSFIGGGLQEPPNAKHRPHTMPAHMLERTGPLCLGSGSVGHGLNSSSGTRAPGTGRGVATGTMREALRRAAPSEGSMLQLESSSLPAPRALEL